MTQASMWHGVLPAITTPFTGDGQVDHEFLASHASQLIDAGCRGVVPLGSLGEAATMGFEEKLAVLRTLVNAMGGRAPVIPGIAALSTDEAVRLAREAKAIGCEGLMVLPPYVYSTDWREMGAHVRAVIGATDLPCMLYNNPIAYTTDFTPAQIAELATEFSNLQAVKESSGDVRRITAVRALLVIACICWWVWMMPSSKVWRPARRVGSPGWSMPSRRNRSSCSRSRAMAQPLYAWFLPLLRFDTVPTFVQLIKLVQEVVGMGSERVRAPRLVLVGAEREAAMKIIRDAIATHPEV